MQWIKIEDGFPPKQKLVLLLTLYNERNHCGTYTYLGMCDKFNKFWVLKDNYNQVPTETVLAWTQLPELPEWVNELCHNPLKRLQDDLIENSKGIEQEIEKSISERINEI